MKKTWFLAVLTILLGTNAFGGACVKMLCDESEHDVSEMLTENGVTGGVNNNQDGRFTSQMCFMCDTGGDSECNYGDTVAIVDNYGNVKNAWQCTNDTGVDDSWIRYNIDKLPICGDSPLNATNTNMNNAKPIEIREGVAARGAVSQKIQQSRRISSLCIYRECMDNYEPGDDGWACMPKKEPQPNPEPTKECTQGSEKITSQADCKNKGTFECVEKDGANCKCGKCNSNNNGYIGKCHSSVCKSEICKACCAKPASETIWDRTAQACQCVNGGNFTKENNQWFCKVKDDSQEETTKCDEALMVKVAEWKVKCSNHATVLSEIEQLESYCAAKPTQDVFLRLYDDLKNTVEKSCIKTSTNTTVDIKTQITNVNNAYSQLTAIHNKFRDNVSVWKDAEGNFNTARLASDTVAGVVLGTAGGLITSSVVKKNQVEDGFEDIKCTIGGQNVAGWGDQFRVGIQ